MAYRNRRADDAIVKTVVLLTEVERDIAAMAGNGELSAGIRTALHYWRRSHPGIDRIMGEKSKPNAT